MNGCAGFRSAPASLAAPQGNLALLPPSEHTRPSAGCTYGGDYQPSREYTPWAGTPFTPMGAATFQYDDLDVFGGIAEDSVLAVHAGAHADPTGCVGQRVPYPYAKNDIMYEQEMFLDSILVQQDARSSLPLLNCSTPLIDGHDPYVYVSNAQVTRSAATTPSPSLTSSSEAAPAALPYTLLPPAFPFQALNTPPIPIKVSPHTETLRLEHLDVETIDENALLRRSPCPSVPVNSSPTSPRPVERSRIPDSPPHLQITTPPTRPVSPFVASCPESPLFTSPIVKSSGRGSRSDRKRQQNRDAAIRYRSKKQQEQHRLNRICQQLRMENSELLRKQTRVRNEIAYVKGLLVDVMKARRERAAARASSTVTACTKQ